MYWSWLQSTGADIRKYLTVPFVLMYGKQDHALCLFTRGACIGTYDYLLVGGRRPSLLASSAAHRGREERSPEPRFVVAAAAWTDVGCSDTW